MNGTEIFSKKNETKSVSMVLNDVEIFQEIKNKGQLSIKKIYKVKNTSLIVKNYFRLKNLSDSKGI